MKLQVIFATFVGYLAVGNVVSWDYVGPTGVDHWHVNYSLCGGSSQSPIHILETNTKYQKFTPFQFTGYGTTDPSKKFDIKNNGHTLQITILDHTGMSVQGFGKTFRPWQIHFHWGKDDSVGSEHTTKPDPAHLHPAEMHFVHVNTAYANTSVALTKYDGLMVFGTIFEVDKSGKNNSFVAKFQKHLKDIKQANTNTNMDSFILDDAFMVPTDKFFHYNGSLTTPTCNEAVQWVVFTGVTMISHAQMEELRHLTGDKVPTNPPKYLSNNYRPVQRLNGRTILRSYSEISSASTIGASLLVLMMSFVARFL